MEESICIDFALNPYIGVLDNSDKVGERLAKVGGICPTPKEMLVAYKNSFRWADGHFPSQGSCLGPIGQDLVNQGSH